MLISTDRLKVYLAAGATDLRKSIDGLTVLKQGGVVTVTQRQLQWLLSGLSPDQRHAHKPVLQRTII